MAIVKCRHCAAMYWRYRRDFPPPHFCSVPCKENHSEQTRSVPPPELPVAIVRAIKDHNRLFHGADSALIDWDCSRCQKLQEEYAASLNYWMDENALK